MIKTSLTWENEQNRLPKNYEIEVLNSLDFHKSKTPQYTDFSTEVEKKLAPKLGNN